MSEAGVIRSAFASDIRIDAAVETCRASLALDPDLILAFVGGKHDPAMTLAALRTAFGAVALAGGAAAGVISAEGSGYTGFELGLVAFKGAAVTPDIVATGGLDNDEVQAGHALGQLVRGRSQDGAAVLLLFDSVASSAPLRLHPGSQLMTGFQAGLGGRVLDVIGGGLLSDINLSDSWMFEGGEVRKHAATALIFPRRLATSTVILHGCRPVSTFMEITRIAGSEVFELNGQPALNVIEQRLGLQLGSTSGQQLSLLATLGQKQGDPFAPYDENNYVNRLILKADPERGSITLFEPDFAVGTKVQIMSRDNALMLDSVERGVAKLKAEIGETGLLGLYIDCAGRASVMTGAATEEAELVLRSLTPAFPFMGFYSGVEIAPFAGNYSRPLDWTGVLTVFHSAR